MQTRSSQVPGHVMCKDVRQSVPQGPLHKNQRTPQELCRVKLKLLATEVATWLGVLHSGSIGACGV